MSGQRLELLVVEENNGKKYYTKAGVAFPNKIGGYNCKVKPGLAVIGEFLLLPPRDKAGAVPAQRAPQQSFDDSNPEDFDRAL